MNINPSSKNQSIAVLHRRNKAGVSIASSLRFEGISHTYDGKQTLKDITLEVEPGEVLCLLGPSGSGKTTLLRIAAGLEDFDSGKVVIDGQVVSEAGRAIPPERRGVGLVFQDYALFPHLTILQNVAYGLKALTRAKASDEARRLLNLVGMQAYADQYPHQLSGGEQQRVALARAFAPRPRILLMDEPFSGLDARLRDSIREETAALLHETRSTAIIVTHDPEEALRVGDHIALMQNGKLIQHGTGPELYYNPKTYFAAQFFTEVNTFEGMVEGGRISTPLGSVEAKGIADGARARVCVRLSDVDILDADTQVLGQNAHVRARQFMGMVELVDFTCEGFDQPVRARLKAALLPDEVNSVRLGYRPGRAMVFPLTDD